MYVPSEARAAPPPTALGVPASATHAGTGVGVAVGVSSGRGEAVAEGSGVAVGDGVGSGFGAAGDQRPVSIHRDWQDVGRGGLTIGQVTCPSQQLESARRGNHYGCASGI